MNINGICVCVNYSDFLAYTLYLNVRHFSTFVVVTDTKDVETKRICEMLNVTCVVTDVFYEGGARFRKGAGINVGLSILDNIVEFKAHGSGALHSNAIEYAQEERSDDWYVHLDSDIILPPDFKGIVAEASLQPDYLYGCDRWMLNSFEEAQPTLSALLEGTALPEHSFERGRRVEPPHVGYTPIGFLQLWNPFMSGIHRYPEKKGDASSDDVHFAYNWVREKRHRIEGLGVYHLDSVTSTMGVNWQGRTTKRFTWED